MHFITYINKKIAMEKVAYLDVLLAEKGFEEEGAATSIVRRSCLNCRVNGGKS